jgi:hypothetical protein
VTRFFPLDAGPDGRLWFFGGGFTPESIARRFIASARVGRGFERIEIVEGQSAPPIGTLNALESSGADFVAGADDGTIILGAYVRPTGSQTSIRGLWAVGPDGAWTLLYAYNTPVAALPPGVAIAFDLFSALALNRDGVYADFVTLTGEGVSDANNSAVITWSAADGLRVIAREGDPVPGDAAGTYGPFRSVHLSDRGDLAFTDPSAIYLHHPGLGVVTVARVGEPVAGGLATNLPALTVTTSYFMNNSQRMLPVVTGPNGLPSWIDDQGRLYFGAWTPPHMVAYSAQLVLPCPADFNGDGFTDFLDYADYVACFEAGECPAERDADFNGDGFVDFFDYADFVSAFEAGCP